MSANEQSVQIEQLEQQLHRTTRAVDRLPLLIQLSENMYFVERARARSVAEEALALAEHLRHKEFIALSLFHLGRAKLYRVAATEVIEELLRAVELFRELGNDDMLVKTLYELGCAHLEIASYQQAMTALTEGAAIAESQQNYRQFAHALGAISHLYKVQGDFPQALQYMFRAIECLESAQIQGRLLGQCYHNLAVIYALIGEREKALETFSNSLVIRREIGDREAEAATLHGLGCLYTEMGRYGEAEEHLQQACVLLREAGNKSMEIYSLTALGILIQQQGRYEETVRLYKRALTLAQSLGSAYPRAFTFYYLGGVYSEKQEYKRAAYWHTKALKDARRVQNSQLEFTAAEALSRDYEQLGDTRKALLYHRMYIHIKEHVLGDKPQRAIAAEQIKFAVRKEKTEKEKYRRKSEVLASEVEHKTKALVAKSLHLVQKTEFLKQVKKQLRDLLHTRHGKAVLVQHLLQQVQQNVISEQEWQAFEEHFEQTHDEFITRIAQLYPSLSPMELKVCSLLKINISSKETARLLSLSVRTINSHRLTIRKKLGLNTTIHLGSYLSSL
jgi:tetratricopeptide (TPR) repeat protein/DNA-binding CsgD family transcriptional regulator